MERLVKYERGQGDTNEMRVVIVVVVVVTWAEDNING